MGAYHSNYILKGPTSSQPTSTKFTAAFTTGKISNSDIFSIINLGNNRIKIKSASGAYLNSFEPKQCSFSENIKYPAGMSSTGADIWLLRPKNLHQTDGCLTCVLCRSTNVALVSLEIISAHNWSKY